MHEHALSRAALPASARCLGRKLRPYSIGHELWLLRQSNSVLRGSPDDLTAAVLICSLSWDELQNRDSRRWLALDLALWGWCIRKMKMDRAKELQKFLSYRDEGLLEFQISKKPRSDSAPSLRLPGSPFILRLQQWLMSHLRKTEAEAWDYPVGLAKMRWACHWEQEGGLDVYNAHEAEEDDFIAKCEAMGGPSALKRVRAAEGAD